MEDEAMDKLFGKPGEPVPAVDFADMKAMLAFMEDVKKRHPEGRVAIGEGIWRNVCSPGADIGAVSYRLDMLWLFEFLLKPAYPGGSWNDAALKAAAKMELTWMQMGTIYNDLPFDVVQFLAQARAEAA
jgi:hypothetical protein